MSDTFHGVPYPSNVDELEPRYAFELGVKASRLNAAMDQLDDTDRTLLSLAVGVYLGNARKEGVDVDDHGWIKILNKLNVVHPEQYFSEKKDADNKTDR